MTNIINKAVIEHLIDGYWYREPSLNWQASHISESRFTALGKQTLFIAMDEKTWLKGTGNTGIYGKWSNTHELIHEYPERYGAVIAQYPVEELDPQIPQYIVQDSFAFINQYATYIREKLTSKVIAVTGTVGKTSTKDYLNLLLSEYGSVYVTHKNHNSRTGVKLTLANAMHNPDYIVTETAMSALWMKSGSISQLARPDIAVITEIGVGQKGYDEIQTAEIKSRIADGIQENGVIILNRDIHKYTELKNYCERYSQQIVSYGYHDDADIKILPNVLGLHLKIEHEIHFFALSHVFDEGTLHNLTAAITVGYSLGLNLKKCQNIFKNIASKSAVLEKIHHVEQQITIIDDTYNAEHLSMLNAFKYCKQHYAVQRKILIVGDIVNLGEKSLQIHQSLAQPIIDNDFSLILSFGKDIAILAQYLPKNKFIGHFTDVQTCIDAILPYLKAQDVILIKGSRRNATIQNIPHLLYQQLTRIKKSEVPLSTVIDLNKIELNHLEQQSNYGLGSLLLLYLALKKHALKEVELTDVYEVTDNVAREGRNKNALGLLKSEVYIFYELLQQVNILQRPDSVLALAELLYGNTNNALKMIKDEAGKIGIDTSKILNVTGRNLKGQIQVKTLKDITLIVKKILELPKKSLHLILNSSYCHKQKIYQSEILFKQHQPHVLQIFVGHATQRIYIFCDFVTKNKIGLYGIDPNLQKHAYDIPYTLNYGMTSLANKKVTHLKQPIINILGDSYFGEFYTRIRKLKGINDALQQFGYSYSFKKIAHFFEKTHFNLINLEASFHQQNISDLALIKPFILGADAEQTLQQLKRLNFNYVTLANNHAKDYGNEGLDYSLKQLDQYQIGYIGAGLNQHEAMQYLELIYQGKKFAIFNGYWHREHAYLDYNFYALGEDSGVCSLDGLINVIQEYKSENPSAKIIVLAHWGVDFKSITAAQRNIAQQLAAAGTDLIIGHGPHTLQPIEKIERTTVIYSIGNGVFNSNGEFTRHQALPYGLIARLDLEQLCVRLYPIFTDNKQTFWQPYTVNPIQYAEIKNFYQQNKNVNLVCAQDHLGQYFELRF